MDGWLGNQGQPGLGAGSCRADPDKAILFIYFICLFWRIPNKLNNETPCPSFLPCSTTIRRSSPGILILDSRLVGRAVPPKSVVPIHQLNISIFCGKSRSGLVSERTRCRDQHADEEGEVEGIAAASPGTSVFLPPPQSPAWMFVLSFQSRHIGLSVLCSNQSSFCVECMEGSSGSCCSFRVRVLLTD